MEMTLALNEELLKQAQTYTGLTTPSELVREALKALIQRESAKSLAAMGGTEPNLGNIPRRRIESR